MTLNFSVPIYNIGTIKKNHNYNGNPKIYFGNTEASDCFQHSSVKNVYNKQYIQNAIKENPNIRKILEEKNIPLNVNFQILQELQETHCKNTTIIAAEIAKNLPNPLKYTINIQNIKDGAILHDIGKILIPTEILNKNTVLTPAERKIIDLHSLLGYELLKNSGVNDEVLKLVKYHHLNKTDIKNFIPDINLQILNLADKYSALTEKRAYKQALSPKQALTILHKETREGNIHPFVFKALVNAVLENKAQVNIS